MKSGSACVRTWPIPTPSAQGAMAETSEGFFRPAARALDAPKKVHFTRGSIDLTAPSARYDLKEKATGQIDLKTGKISFTVSNPTKVADIDGTFEGTVSPRLDVINCVWISKGNGQQGDLKLTARAP